MKKIFPAITILVFISALGIIYFQYLWIRQSLQDREYQFEETMNMVTYNTAQALTEVKGKMSPFDNHRNNDLLIPLNVFPFTVAHRFSRDEVRDLINKMICNRVIFSMHIMIPSIIKVSFYLLMLQREVL